MKKKILKILLIIVLVVFGLLLGVKLILNEAFGPKYRTVKIELDNNRKLICEETYNSDFAAVFYDVNFILKKNDKYEIVLGQATFSNENWDKDLTLLVIEDWIILSIDQGSYSKILMTNQNLKITKDTAFSPLDLRYDKIWKNRYSDIPAWSYGGESKIDSIVKNAFYVTYKYRIGINRPFKFYNQTIGYELDLRTGIFITDTIYDRHEK